MSDEKLVPPTAATVSSGGSNNTFMLHSTDFLRDNPEDGEELVRRRDLPKNRFVCKACETEVWMDSQPTSCPTCSEQWPVAKKYNPQDYFSIEKVSDTPSIMKQRLWSSHEIRDMPEVWGTKSDLEDVREKNAGQKGDNQ